MLLKWLSHQNSVVSIQDIANIYIGTVLSNVVPRPIFFKQVSVQTTLLRDFKSFIDVA